jgi:hypothetical protein
MATMKLFVVALAVVLSGCSIILPKPHDPVMLDQLAIVKVSVNQLQCGEPKHWDEIESKIQRLEIYTEWRADPQAPSVKSLKDSLKKAGESKNKTFCESLLKINKTRIDVIADAWKGRK